ncbi:uncharacterized protein G2W53_037040 [Senna tora]|uniref:Transmembrane protein n=1 Tax=Senna tora TaxID=362788 RepID=A0A834SV66_9FABA|nr:uncharacterized protein G2W53_037040 [Senna tora]
MAGNHGSQKGERPAIKGERPKQPRSRNNELERRCSYPHGRTLSTTRNEHAIREDLPQPLDRRVLINALQLSAPLPDTHRRFTLFIPLHTARHHLTLHCLLVLLEVILSLFVFLLPKRCFLPLVSSVPTVSSAFEAVRPRLFHATAARRCSVRFVRDTAVVRPQSSVAFLGSDLCGFFTFSYRSSILRLLSAVRTFVLPSRRTVAVSLSSPTRADLSLCGSGCAPDLRLRSKSVVSRLAGSVPGRLTLRPRAARLSGRGSSVNASQRRRFDGVELWKPCCSCSALLLLCYFVLVLLFCCSCSALLLLCYFVPVLLLCCSYSSLLFVHVLLLWAPGVQEWLGAGRVHHGDRDGLKVERYSVRWWRAVWRGMNSVKRRCVSACQVVGLIAVRR